MNKPKQETELRSSIYENLSVILAAMAAPVRLRIVQILAQSPRSVEEISQEVQQSVANTSQHLQKMLAAGLLKCQRKGVSKQYSIADMRALEIWEKLQELGDVLDSDIATATEELVPEELCSDLSLEAIHKKVAAGRAVLVDMRDAKERLNSRVSWASALEPEDILAKDLNLATSKEYFIFCRGRYCGLANKAVIHLRKHGFKAYRLRQSPFLLEQAIQGAN